MSGFMWAVYETDDGRLFGLRVDASRLDQANRGWLTVGVDQTNPFPRLWRPRLVIGLDPDGRVRQARIGRLDAPLWTGGASTFSVERNDGTVVQATVIGRRQERTPQPRPPTT